MNIQQFLTKKVILIAGALAVVLIIAVSVVTNQQRQPVQQSAVVYRPAFSSTLPIASVIVGRTTQQAVSQLPGISQAKRIAPGVASYTLSHNASILPDTITTTNNVVSYESITMPSAIQTNGLTSLQQYITAFGQPTAIFYGSRTYGQTFVTYFYQQQGVAVTADRYSGEIYVLQLFTPVTPTTYLKQYGQDILSTQDNAMKGSE